MSTGKTGVQWQVISRPIFIALSCETDFGFALSAQLTAIGFSPSWRLGVFGCRAALPAKYIFNCGSRDACLCFFVLIYKIT
jgi:hypothetical protein